jgi:mRNA interferase YafQ
VVKELMNDRPLDEKHCNHKLSGDYEGVRECHVESDWLLIYDKSGDIATGKLTLIRTGSHSELF